MRIAIVNDMQMAREALRRAVLASGEHSVAWVAHDGQQAVQQAASDRPDLILMDLIMPVMDGVEATQRIMAHTPCAILLVTGSPDDQVGMVFKALGHGAMDVTATPILAGGGDGAARLLAKIRMIGKLIGDSAQQVAAAEAPCTGSVRKLIAVGASTGGPVAIARILADWVVPSDTCVVVVQHIDRSFADTFASWLAGQVVTPVRVISAGDSLAGGQILIAKSNDHLIVDRHGGLAYQEAPVDYPYRPSVNVFFRSVAEHWRGQVVGVLLTGMGADGAEGLLALRQSGKYTIAQDQASSTVYGMPKAAAELNAANAILPLDSIAGALRKRIEMS